jgi:hypothetical protein
MQTPPLAALSRRLVERVLQVLTGADNKTLAIGRVMSVPYLLATLALPYVLLRLGREFSLTDAGVYITASAGGFMALVRGTDWTEPDPK